MKKTKNNEVILELRKHPSMKVSDKIQKGLQNVHTGMPYTLYIEIDQIPDELTGGTIDYIHLESESGLINRQYRDYVDLRTEWDPVEGHSKRLINLCGNLVSRNDII